MVTKRCRQRNLHKISYTIKYRVKTRMATRVAVSTERVKLQLIAFNFYVNLKAVIVRYLPHCNSAFEIFFFFKAVDSIPLKLPNELVAILGQFSMQFMETTRLCPYILEPARLRPHVCAQTRLCPDMFVPRHVCAQTRLCPDMFVPTHVCALTCYNRVVTIMSGQKRVRLCPDMFEPRNTFCALTYCNNITKYSSRK